MKYALILALLWTPQIQAEIYVDEEGRSHYKSYTKLAEDGFDLRRKKRAAVGFSALGAHGTAGVNLELNFTPDHSLVAGYGGGDSFSSYSFQYKKVLAGEFLLPYLGLGLAHWRGNSSEDIEKTSPGFLLKTLMDEKDKQLNQVRETLIYPSFGLQFVQLGGDLAGHSLFAEIMILVDFEDFEAVPTGSVGYLFYF